MDRSEHGQSGKDQEFETEEASHAGTNSRLAAPLPIRTSGPVALDITEDFTNASSALKTGQLVKDEYFTLFESVGALEIMDPKMDSGYLKPGEGLEDDYDVSRELNAEEVIGIMDQLLSYEAAWHMGNPLSQTLFTSLYLDRLLYPPKQNLPEIHFSLLVIPNTDKRSLLHNVLRPFCIGLLKCCGLVHHQITKQHFYEEEDFVSHTFNRDLLTAVAVDEISTLISESVEFLEETQSSRSEDLTQALKSRLGLRASLLQALALEVSDLSSTPEDLWKKSQRFLSEVKSSSPLGTSVSGAFSVKLQRRLASTLPPRPIVRVDFEQTISHFCQMCKDVLDMLQIFDYKGSLNLFNFLWAFQSRKPHPSVYVRSLLQKILFAENGENTGNYLPAKQQIIHDNLVETTLPAHILLDPANRGVEVPGDPRFEINNKIELFLARAETPFFDLFRALCQNRSRIRRTLCHTLLDWEVFQLDTEELESELQALTQEKPHLDLAVSKQPIFSFPLSSWAYDWKLKQMKWILHLGFELEVYQLDELGSMYWYLQYLCQTRISHLERIRSFLSARLKQISKTRSTTKKSDIEAVSKSLSYITGEIETEKASKSLADALNYVLVVLSRLEILQGSERPYSSDALRYELRMRPFFHISLPEFLPHLHFTTLADQKTESIRDLLLQAQTSLSHCRKELEQVLKISAATKHVLLCEEAATADVKCMMRACIAAGVSVSYLQKCLASSKDRGAKLKLDTSRFRMYHDWWHVPSLK